LLTLTAVYGRLNLKLELGLVSCYYKMLSYAMFKELLILLAVDGLILVFVFVSIFVVFCTFLLAIGNVG
jgi:hypothetical protein